MSDTHVLRTEAFSQLLPAALDTLELSQRIAVEDDVQHRQAVVQSTSQLKERFTAAKQIAQSLPGGDLSIAEQDELINLLERLRDERLKLLHVFSTTPVSTTNRLS